MSAIVRPYPCDSEIDNEFNRLLRKEEDRGRRALRVPVTDQQLALDQPLTHVAINTATIGDNTIIPGISGRLIDIYALLIWNVTSMNLELKDDTGYTFTGPLNAFPAASGVMLPNVGEPWFTSRPGAGILLNLSAATQVSGFMLYRWR